MEAINKVKDRLAKKLLDKNKEISSDRRISWIGAVLTAAAVFLFDKRLLDKKQVAVITLTVIIAVIAVLAIKNYWPLCILVGCLLCLYFKTDKEGKITYFLFIILFLLSTAIWSTGLFINMTPPGQKIQALKDWPTLKNLLFMLTGTGYSGYMADKARSIWCFNQIWYIPVLYFLSRLISISITKNNTNKLHGSAHFIEPHEVGLTSETQGFLLGKEKNGRREVVLPMNEVFEHIIMDGAPGAGKTAGVFTPNLLRIAEKGGYANLVITDPKGELLSICGPELKKAGYEVIIYHPYNPELTNAWNMLYYADSYDAADDMIQTIIHNITQGSKGGNQHWDNQANILLALASYHLRCKLGEKANMSHLQAMATAKPKDIEVTLRNSENDKIRINAQGFFSQMESNDRIITSVMNNVPKLLKLWSLDPIRATTSINEINFSDLCSNKKIALFVITPLDKKDQLRPLFATFFSQMFKVIQEKGRELGKLPRPLMIFLEEAANVGAIPNFDSFLTVVRGYRVGLFIAIQDMSQLSNIYGPEKAKTILGACATYIVSPRISKDDAKYFSEMIGNTTIDTIEKKYKKTLAFREIGHSESEKAVKRPLITPDEIRALDKNEDLIVISGNRRPVHIAPALYYRDKRWMELAKDCLNESVLQKRRSIFLRENRGLDLLEVPGEEKMMQEAIMATATVIPKNTDNTPNTQVYKPGPVPITNTATEDLQVIDDDEPPLVTSESGRKSKVALNLDSVKVIKKGNPFSDKK